MGISAKPSGLSSLIDLVEPESDDPRLRSKVADVRDANAVVAAVDALAEAAAIKHVVALAGAVLPGESGLLKSEPSEAADLFSSSVQLNLVGQFNLLRASLPKLTAADGDRSVILCSSINALAGYGAPAYSAAKAGLIGMMHALAGPLGREGVRINVVAPGMIRTPATEAEAAASGNRKSFKRLAKQTHLGKVGAAAEVATAIESLADRMPHVTDQVLRVDGGQLGAR